MSSRILFHKSKRPINIDKVYIKIIVLSSKESYSKRSTFKYFVGYLSNIGIIPLYMMLPQLNAYVKYINSNNKYRNILVHDKEFLKNTMQYGIRLVIY